MISKLTNNQDVPLNPPQDTVAYEGLVQDRVNLITTLRSNGKDSLVLRAIKDLLLIDGRMVAGNCGFMVNSYNLNNIYFHLKLYISFGRVTRL